jgi:Plasmid encoded RepA protein
MNALHRQIELFGREEVERQAIERTRRVLGDPNAPGDAETLQRIRWAAEILGNEDIDIGFLHAGFCQASLPHRQPKEEKDGVFKHWVRSNGSYTLMISPGSIPPAKGGTEPRLIGIPYGTRARLILLYLQTTAKRNRSRTVDLGETMSAFLRRLGLIPSGGNNGTIKAVKEQALRIARCSFTMRWENVRGGSHIADHRIVNGLELWSGDAEGGEWARTVQLSAEFYDHLLEHSVPLDEAAIARLKESSMSLDIYVYLAHRLRRLSKPLTLYWQDLVHHFGDGNDPRAFRHKFRPALLDVLAVYPGAQVEFVRGGVRMLPSQPPIPSNLISLSTCKSP